MMYCQLSLAFLTPADFLQATLWSLGTTAAFGLLALLAFLLQWGVRFRFVGITGFMAVLTVGLFSLSLFPITTTLVPGSVPYSVVYDNGGGQVVIKLPNDINESQLEATLRQAAINQFSPGRLGQNLLIRGRVLLHPEEDVTEPLFIGQVTRSQSDADENDFNIEINREALARL
ncbi:Ycf51 family protein [Phormidium yuhuli AB48]|uniref:Ycf51 family protein n=1 Tax=Phormidium yuhuli AB48 TaxID=2940671 RepID=A0ABY5ALQ5_9CYAN|nr:Ycf51 family protein [Phormidium yuhuli]USR89945.1 Ycf51 family protein [Phormidium yuhuli AB48]